MLLLYKKYFHDKGDLVFMFFHVWKKKLKRKYKWRLKFASWIFTISQTCNHQYTKDDEKKRWQKYGLYYQKMMIWRIFSSIFFWYLIINILKLKYCKFRVWSSNVEPIASGFCLAKWIIIQLKYLINGNLSHPSQIGSILSSSIFHNIIIVFSIKNNLLSEAMN